MASESDFQRKPGQLHLLLVRAETACLGVDGDTREEVGVAKDCAYR